MKFKRCVGVILFMVLVLTACSPDPRVAPFKAWIVGVDAPVVLYNKDYGTRVIILQKGEEAEVQVVHNRCHENNGKPLHDITIGLPSTDDTYIASVEQLQEYGKFRIKALDEGCAYISIKVKGEKVKLLKGLNEVDAYTFVIVEDGNDDDGGISVRLSKVNGVLTGNIGDVSLHRGDVMTFEYQGESNISVDHVEWYVDGVLKGTTGDGGTFDYVGNLLGNHKVRCIVYGYRYGEWTLGHSDEVNVKVNL